MCGEQPIILYNHQTVLLNKTTFLILGGGGNCFSFGMIKLFIISFIEIFLYTLGAHINQPMILKFDHLVN